ncbi:MAG: TetR/AcrR family transcriptional regulator [Litorilinea sp.]
MSHTAQPPDFMRSDSPLSASPLSESTQPDLDVRSHRTRLQIRDAFMALLLEKDFDRITVSELVKRADINRTTFYRHYADIYDLAHRLTDILFVDINAQFNRLTAPDAPPPNPPPNLPSSPPPTQSPMSDPRDWELLFIHVQEFAAFYRAMLQPGGIPGFRARVESVVVAQMEQLLPAYGLDPAAAPMPMTLALHYIAAAQVGFMQWWLENDMPFPPAQAAAHLRNLHLRGGLWALGMQKDTPPP